MAVQEVHFLHTYENQLKSEFSRRIQCFYSAKTLAKINVHKLGTNKGFLLNAPYNQNLGIFAYPPEKVYFRNSSP